ncbi:MAG: antitoxin [Acidimicrobiales bacterium]
MNIAKLAQKAKAVVDNNGDKIAAGVGKATDFVDKKTKGKHHDKLEKIDDLAAKLDKTKGDGYGATGDKPTPPPPG